MPRRAIRALHPSTIRDVRARRIVQRLNGEKRYMCSCLEHLSAGSEASEITLCPFHEGYDLGVEYGEAMEAQRCSERYGGTVA